MRTKTVSASTLSGSAFRVFTRMNVPALGVAARSMITISERSTLTICVPETFFAASVRVLIPICSAAASAFADSQ